MKRRICIIVVWSLFMTLCACTRQMTPMENWDCSVTCMEISDADSYIISYSDQQIPAEKGVLTFQNQNTFDIVVHLIAPGKEERTIEIQAGSSAALYQLDREKLYTVGCHAEVEKGTEIKLKVYEGEGSDVF